MNIRIEDINDTRKKLLVQVAADEVDQEHGEIVKEIARTARLPGFRPGRAPLPMVAKRYTKEIKEELQKQVVSKAYRKALEETKISLFALIELPEAEVVQGQEVELSFVVDIRPDFEIPTYQGLEINKPSEEVVDEEIDKMIEEIRGQRADYQPADRAATKGDFVKLSYKGTIDGKPVEELVPERPIYGEQSATWEEIGSEEAALPGLSEALEGMKTGDKKDVTIEFAEESEEEALRGKTAVYSVEIFEVRERILPELTEEFIKGLGVESEEVLRTRIREDLERQKKSDSRAAQRQQIAEKLASAVEFGVPESAVEQETESILRQFLETNIRRGVDQKEFEGQKEELHEGARQGAVHRVKVQLILSRIAETEKIKVDDEDLSRYVYFQSMSRREKPEKMVRELRKNPKEVDSIRQGLLFDKVLDFLQEKATISETAS